MSIRMVHSGSTRAMKPEHSHTSCPLYSVTFPESMQPTEDINYAVEAPVVLHKETPEQLHCGETQTGRKDDADAMVTYTMFWVTQ